MCVNSPDPASVVREPADATVARLVGYENVVPVETDPAGRVLLAGIPCGLVAAPRSEGTLAAWGGAIILGPPGDAPLDGTVERVTAGPGRWEVQVRAGFRLRAHVSLGSVPPGQGERVSVEIDPARATVIASSARSKGVRPEV